MPIQDNKNYHKEIAAKEGKVLVLGVKGYLLNSLRQNWPAYLIVTTIFVLGIIAGSFGEQNLQADQKKELNLYLESFLRQAGALEIDASKSLGTVLYNNVAVVLALYLLGLTVIGVPLMLAIMFGRGYVLGFALNFLAGEKSFKGIILAFAAVLPANIVLIPALLMGGVASFSFTLLLFKRFFNSKVLVWPSFVAYSGIMLIVVAFTAGSGLVEVYLTPLFLRLAAMYTF